jgi:protein-L-isoaspartate(D-aspartate) O-methyltransferase
MIDEEQRRILMVETQLRPNEVTDWPLIAAMRAVPRERFVPERYRGLAYMDEVIEVLPASEARPARYLLSPMVQARLIQLAEVGPDDTVLDIGCGTGYSTAILGRLAFRVVGLEDTPELVETAKANLASLGVTNAEVLSGLLSDGAASHGPYDVIVIEGSIPSVPERLGSQLKMGGRLVSVVTPSSNIRLGKAYLQVRTETETAGLPQFDAGAPPLPGFAPAPSFAF